MEKLNYIIKEINNIRPFNKFISQAIQERKQFYTDTSERLENISIEKIRKHCFLSEVLEQSENLEKLNLAPKLINKVTKLETHQNAPELNKIHFKNHHINVPQAKTIDEAIAQIIQNNTINSLKLLNLNI
jgi:hypothetical protein